MDKFLVVANWKANNVDPESWVQKLAGVLDNPSAGVDISVAASYVRLHELTYILGAIGASQPVSVCSQDVSLYSEGAFTGEVTASILRGVGVKHALIGHSERRKYFGETTEIVGKKSAKALEAGITPIICAQTPDEIPANISQYPPDKLLIMYEPFEAISTDGNYHAENPETISQTLLHWQKALPAGVRFLYGGSVNPDNIGEILTSCAPMLSGFVVGHASLDPVEFSSIIKKCLQRAA